MARLFIASPFGQNWSLAQSINISGKRQAYSLIFVGKIGQFLYIRIIVLGAILGRSGCIRMEEFSIPMASLDGFIY